MWYPGDSSSIGYGILRLAEPRSHAPNMCTRNTCYSEKREKVEKMSVFSARSPPLCNEKSFLVRPRSGKVEPFRGLYCHFVDQKVAHVSHTPETPRPHTDA